MPRNPDNPKRGQPTKLTDDLHAKVVSLLRAGNFLETAAGAVGIERATLRDLMRRGARDIAAGQTHTKEAAFAKDTQEALLSAELLMVATVRRQGERDWKAIKWLLETTRPLRFGPRQRLDIEVTEVGPERLKVLRALLAAKGDEEE